MNREAPLFRAGSRHLLITLIEGETRVLAHGKDRGNFVRSARRFFAKAGVNREVGDGLVAKLCQGEMLTLRGDDAPPMLLTTVHMRIGAEVV